VQKLLIKCLVLTALLAMHAFPTESRIEAMGKRDVFFRDDMSIFRNPANVGIFGNFVTGALGFADDVSDSILAYSGLLTLDTGQYLVPDINGDTLSIPMVRDTTIYDTITRTSTLTNQWFGVVHNFKINKKLGVFGGAAFNRTDEFLSFYDSLKITREHRRGINMPTLRGKTDFMLGVKFNKINVGAGYYHASQDSQYQVNVSKTVQNSLGLDSTFWEIENHGPAVSLNRFNVGTEVGIGKHSLEVSGGMGTITYSNKTLDSTFNLSETTDLSIFAGTRFFMQTSIGGGLVFVPAVNFRKCELFNDNTTNISGGVGLNLRLDRGFFWAGVEGEMYDAENDSLDITVSGIGARFNFGIEKSLIFKWLMVRVGGSKYIGIQSTKAVGITTDEWVENAVDDGTSKDFLGFGIGLNYQNRLRFDITLNESLPYFNPFGRGLEHSSNGGHMLLRISSTFSL
jgi:hypothetical protein